MNIYEKIQDVKIRLLKANIKKSGFNKFAGFNYYELADFLPTIIQICNEIKLFTAPSFDKELAKLTIVNIEKPEETFIYTSPMEELELKGCNKVQALGGTETYQRRYLYMAAFDITENDMFDGTQTEEKPKTIDRTHIQALEKAIENANISADKVTRVLEKFGCKSITDILATDYMNVCNAFKEAK